MNFLNIGAAAFAVILPIIILMYLLKLKRKRMTVSSTMLWRKSIEDLVANAPFQRLRRNLLLYLQLLIAALLVLAMMRPMIKMSGVSGKKYIVLIDNSASMKTRDAKGGATRMEESRTLARRLIDEMAKGDTMTLIGFSNQTRILQNETDDKNLLRSALLSVNAVDTATDITEALLIADSLARPEYQQAGRIADTDDASMYDPRSRIVIFSDGKFNTRDLKPSQAGNISFVPVGSTGENVGITEMDITTGLEEEATPIVFANVKNFSVEEQSRLLYLFIDDGEADIRSVKLKPDEEVSVHFKPFESPAVQAQALSTTHTVRLELRSYSDAQEANEPFTVDDTAYGVMKPPQPLNILLVSDGNFFLERLMSLIPNSEVVRTGPGNYTPSTQYDLTVFDNFSPQQLPPGQFLFLHAIPPIEEFQVKPEEVQFPIVVDWNRVHLLTRFVNFDGIGISSAIDVTPPPWARVLVESDRVPLVMAFERDDVRAAIVTFDIFSSDWPLRPSFPIFINNAVRWLSRARTVREQPVLRTGTVLPLAAKGEEQTFSITDPSGKTHTVRATAEKANYFADTLRAGIYRVRTGASEESYPLAFNLLSLEESSILPRQSLEMSREIVTASTEILESDREIWRWLVWGALLFLVIEWFIYCRRSWT